METRNSDSGGMMDSPSSEQKLGRPLVRQLNARDCCCMFCIRKDVDGVEFYSTHPSRTFHVHVCLDCLRKVVEIGSHEF